MPLDQLYRNLSLDPPHLIAERSLKVQILEPRQTAFRPANRQRPRELPTQANFLGPRTYECVEDGVIGEPAVATRGLDVALDPEVHPRKTGIVVQQVVDVPNQRAKKRVVRQRRIKSAS